MKERSGANTTTTASRPSEHECTDVLVPFVVLVDLYANEVGFGAKPVHPADTALPTAAHARAALLVRLSDAALCAGPLAKRVPFFRGDALHERRVHGVEHVEARQRQRRLCLSVLLRGADRPDDDDPRQLRRAQDEPRVRRYRRFRRGLRERDGREGRMHCAVDDGACGGGEGYVV